MRLPGIAILALCTLGSATGARAEVEYPWCVTPSRFTVGTCYYATLEQCMAAASGNVGSCTRNSRYVAPLPARQTRARN
jgi:Protein of unknown function (DUF3551)